MASESANERTGFEQLRDEFSRFWQRLPCKGLFLSLLVVWFALFYFLGNSTLGYTNRPSLFGWLDWVVSKHEDDQHGPWILVVVLALLWWKRKELQEAPKRNWWPALTIVAVGLLLHALGYMVQQTRISIVGFFVGIYGLVGVVWGPQILRATFFPMFLFAFCVPLAGTLGDSMTLPLRIMAAKITQAVCNWLFGIHVIQDGTRIFDANGAYNYDVAAACSGIRSLTAILALAVIYGFVMFKSTWWRRLVMIATAIPLAIAANVVRLTSIIIASEAFGHATGKFVHENKLMSLMPYIVPIGGILLLGHWIREKRLQHASEASPPWTNRELGTVLLAFCGFLTLYFKPTERIWNQVFGNFVPLAKQWIFEHQYTSVWLLIALLVAALAFMARQTSPEKSTVAAQPRQGWSALTASLALIMIVASGFALHYRQGHQKLGQPGVRVAQTPIYDPEGKVVGTNSIALPEHVLNYESEVVPVDRIVLDWLPKDTTYGQRLYKTPDGFSVQMNAVLMGTDRTSIHQPQYCLTGNGWQINQTETENIQVNQPRGYDLPVNKLTVSRTVRDANGAEGKVSGIYVYWFVAENRLTAQHGQRMLDMGLDMLRTGVLQRWAYVSCFSVCLPGGEETTYNRIKELITAAVPQFQLTTGQPTALAINQIEPN